MSEMLKIAWAGPGYGTVIVTRSGEKPFSPETEHWVTNGAEPRPISHPMACSINGLGHDHPPTEDPFLGWPALSNYVRGKQRALSA